MPSKSILNEYTGLAWHAANSAPNSPIEGDTYYNTHDDCVYTWVNQKWVTVSTPFQQSSYVQTWEIVTDDGFYTINIFITPLTSERNVHIKNNQEEIIEEGLDNVLNKLRSCLNKKQYLWNESRILNFFT